jgi:hypothetical protein
MKRKFIWVVVVLSLLLTPLVAWRLVTRDVDRRLAAIRAAGLPTSGEELNQWYASVPDDQNAALLVTNAVGLLRSFESTDNRYWEIRNLKTPLRGQSLDVKQRRLLSDYVAMNAAALAKAHEAARLPKSCYPIDLRQGEGTLLPHLRLKALARLEEYTALLALGTSSSNQVVVSIASILDLARTLEEEPIVVSQDERTRLLACAKDTLERSLAMTSFGSAELASLQDAFSKSEKTNLMVRGLIGERAMYIPLFRTNINEIERLRKDLLKEESLPLTGRRWWNYRTIQWLNHDLSFFLDAMETNIVLTLSPPGNLLAESNAQAMITVAKQRQYALSAICLPKMQKVLRRERSGLAHLRLSSAALAVERFRLSEGRLPAKIEELSPQFLPAVPADPFDGAPLRYRRLAKGYIIHSIGQDQNNADDEDPWIGLTSDLTFTVER